MTNPDMTNASVSDTIWTITNLGNTTSAYDVRLLLRGTEVPDGFTTQLMIYRTYQTPVSRDCQLSVQTQNLLVATIPNPPILPAGSPVGFDPADGSLQHATLWLAPGESARVALRVLDPDKTDDLRFDPLASVTAAAIAHAVDSDAAASGVTEPTPVTPKGALLSFEQPPTQSPIGGLVTPPVRVWLRDESGASVPGVTVTLSLVSGPAGAAVHGGTAVTGADGRATFPSLWLDRVGHYQLRASAAGRDVDAASFDVVPLVVDGTADAGPGSLREAILNANRNVGYADSISFAIPESGPHTIIPTSGALPYVTDPVTIDATTQPGYLSTPVVELSGGGGAPWGLAITGGSSTVRGLAISGFTPGWGIGLFRPGEGNVIQGNFVGTDATGTVARGNNEGIIVDSANNLVGGAAPGERNVIAGNLADGVNVQSGASANRIVGNYIGTDVSGSIVLGTGQFGISITNATGNVVGGPEPGAGNVVAGSTHAGVRVAGSAATGTQILGNRIGTNAAGTAALGNSWAGVLLDSSAAETLVGGMGPGQRNLISGNTGVGIHVSGSNRNRVEGNYVGTNAAGDAPLPNTGMGGVWITGEDNEVRGNLVSGNANTGVTINGGLRTVLDGNSIGTNAGGTAALPNAAGGVNYSGSGPASHAIRNNVVSGNAYYGIWLTGADHVSVTGNRIGTNAAGNAALPNGAPGGGFTYGLRLAGCIDSVVGGPSAGDGNVVSGNVGDGILLDTYAEFGIVNCVVQGNHVGMDAAGANAIPNTGVGVQVLPSLAPVAQIGSFAIDGNLISGNGLAGVSLSNGVHHLALTRNTIGTDLGGSLARPNGGTGVDAFGDVHDVVIGGAAASANLISGNAGHGVQLVAPGPPAALHNEVSFNLIGTNRAGATAIGNGMSGIAVSGGQAHDNRVAGNLISGNGASGVSIAGGAHDNVVVGNTIGTDAAAALALPNHENGVILSAAPDNVIGAVDEGNVIAGNSRFGVALYPGSDRNVIVGNWIGTNSSATADLGNGGYGVFMSGSSMNRLGGLGQGNTIAHNALAGIGLANASNTTGNRFWMNSVFENGGLGVDLGNDGVTANDPLDGDSGPNDLLNHPVLTAATAHDGVTTVTATVDIPLGFAEIQFFVNESCDASGHGEGGTYVGSEGLNSPGGGPTLVNVDLPGEFAGRFLTAATSMISPVRETSEFSACRLVVPSTTVVDTFDAAGTFHPQNNTVAADGYAPPLMPMSPATRAAVRFTLPPASSQYQLASISLPISFQGTDAATLRVRLAQDSAGLPGPTLEVLSHNESRWPAFTNPFATTTTLSSPTGPVLVGGASYWIVVELTAFPSGSADYRWFQNQSGTGLLPVLQQQIDSSTPGWLPQDLPGDPWTGPTVTSSVQPLALRVEAVPLP
jgi:parallel beta-helix repeat protein